MFEGENNNWVEDMGLGFSCEVGKFGVLELGVAHVTICNEKY